MRLAASLIIALVAAASASAASLQVPPPAVAGRAAVPTKKPSWEFLFDSPQAAMNPVTFKDRAYVTTNTTLYALDARNGKLAWSFSYRLDESAPFATNGGYAAATDELVVIGTFDKVIAVFPNNGTLAWTYRPPSGKRPDGYDGIRPRFGYGGPDTKGIYITTGYSPLRKLSMTGYVMWTAPSSTGTARFHANVPRPDSDVFFISEVEGKGPHVVALNPFTGVVAWQKHVPDAVAILTGKSYNVVLVQGVVTRPDGRADGTLTALGFDGRVRYELVYENEIYVDDFVVDTALYTMSAAALEPFKPATFYKYTHADSIESSRHYEWKVAADSLFYTPCSKGMINFGVRYIDGYDAKNGTHAWRLEGVAVNAGAVVESTDAVISVLKDRVIALEF